jgi:hypothetical protein
VSSVPRANDLTGFNFSTLQRLAVMGTAVLYGVKLGATAYDKEGEPVDICREGLGIGK